MSIEIMEARVIHSDSRAGRFLALSTEDQQLAYSHWRAFQKAGYPAVQVGQVFKVCLGRDARDGETLVVREVIAECEAENTAISGAGLDSEQQLVSDRHWLDHLNVSNGITVVANKVLNGSEIFDLDIPGSLVLINCKVVGDFRWIRARFEGSFWCLNCQFENHFSLKSANLDGSVVIFGCDFSGPGGISFRGIKALSVLIEFGTRGSDDMLWLNEMTLRGCLTLNGSFEAPVQLLAKQDDAPVNTQPRLNNVYIGRQSYHAEHLSRNEFSGGICVDGYDLVGDLEVHRSTLGQLKFADIKANSITVRDCELTKDLSMNRVSIQDETKGIAVEDSMIGRNLRMTGKSLRGRCRLSGTSVDQSWILELEKPEDGTPAIEMARFHAAQAWFDPVSLIYGSVPIRRLMSPPPFALLANFDARSSDVENRRLLSEAYTRFKNWLADTGHLREEDHAFFHMRDYKESGRLRRLILGGFFGWGIRLRNVLCTALLVIGIFAFAFALTGFPSSEALMLSLQSFISILFGEWSLPVPSATSWLSLMVTMESMIGVLLVTVLIGAYIRKLLR